jgi:hypothetical protein
MRTKTGTCTILALLLGACGGSDPAGGDGDGDGDGIPSYSVSGTAVDFAGGDAIAGQATVGTSGLTPPPTVSVTGADFTIDGVPPHSLFNPLVGAPPDYRNTYGAAIEVLEADVDGVIVEAVSESYLASLVEAFAVDPSGAKGVLLAQTIDDQGDPLAGIPAEAFTVDGSGFVGPFFLDADRAPAPALDQTSASGWVVFFDVDPGLVAVAAAADSGYTMTMSSSPIAAAAATLATVEVVDGEVVTPTGVSFSRDVVPIFQARGCTACHSGGGIGKDLGGLMLDSGVNKTFTELTTEISPNMGTTRVNLADPEASLVLRFPSAESPPDDHPNVTFTGPTDTDYLIILGWITEGAQQN